MYYIFLVMLDKELKDLENELTSKHQVELTAAEERVKHITVKYFSEEISKIEMKHKCELQVLVEKEQKIFEDLKRALVQKEKEVLSNFEFWFKNQLATDFFPILD